ncbi:hypothetical protein BDV93DRAFT_587284 [Ceratobasidium sp. AG-I]|nr:hypothetical protein BDV93DRAFT_587284 [Ceratobasidium sp. AG-I]
MKEGYILTSAAAPDQSEHLKCRLGLESALYSLCTMGETVVIHATAACLNDDLGITTQRFKIVQRSRYRSSIHGKVKTVLFLRSIELPEEARRDVGEDTIQTRKRKAEALEEDESLPQKTCTLKLTWEYPRQQLQREFLWGVFGSEKHPWCRDQSGRRFWEAPSEDHLAAYAEDTIWRRETRLLKMTEICGEAPVEEHAINHSNAEGGLNSSARRDRIHSRTLLLPSVGGPIWTATSVEEFLEGFLGTVLAYWCLVNLGILHRDISDGNSMRLRGAQAYSRREWLQDDSRDVEALKKQFGEMAKSELELRKVLKNLNRDPSGMMTDFDLHTKHSSAAPPGGIDGVSPCMGGPIRTTSLSGSCESPTAQAMHQQDPEVSSKQLKANSNTSVPVIASSRGKGRARALDLLAKIRRTSQADEGRPRMDFRTGTPTFMSVRVLETKGARYTHNFMDDLESFFWLLVWKSATDNASYTLQMLDNDQMETISMFKSKVLKECSDDEGQKIFVRLHSFTDEWASHPSFIWLIFKMGTYFYSRVYSGRGSPQDPGVVFPEIVKMVTNALSIA